MGPCMCLFRILGLITKKSFEPLGSGVTFDSFYLVRTIPLLTGLLNKAVTLRKMTQPVTLSIVPEISSGPFVSIDCKSSSTCTFSLQTILSRHTCSTYSLLHALSPDKSGSSKVLKHSAKNELRGFFLVIIDCRPIVQEAVYSLSLFPRITTPLYHLHVSTGRRPWGVAVQMLIATSIQLLLLRSSDSPEIIKWMCNKANKYISQNANHGSQNHSLSESKYSWQCLLRYYDRRVYWIWNNLSFVWGG